MKISLSPDVEQLIAEGVKSGRYQSADEAVREGLKLLEEHEKETRRAPSNGTPNFMAAFESIANDGRVANASIRECSEPRHCRPARPDRAHPPQRRALFAEATAAKDVGPHPQSTTARPPSAGARTSQRQEIFPDRLTRAAAILVPPISAARMQSDMPKNPHRAMLIMRPGFARVRF